MTIQEVILVNPKVGLILDKASNTEKPTIADYERFKKELSNEVGHDCKYFELQNYKAYEAAIVELCGALKI